MSYIEPQVADFKTYFVRDFPYGGTNGDLTTVQDSDIQTALTDADAMINQDLWSTQSEFSTAFLNLAAHWLVTNIRTSSQGLSGSMSWLESSKSVGSVSESFAIPQSITENPRYAMLAKTNYGAKFLMMMIPYVTGQMFSVFGGTNA